ncbi:hypothetical protein FNH22_17665 [Fulvivirga sp. M361]|uniref:hypothetical protein n=1 Tax=Fulvivirga sp. M361 TaxID=2594266 RepID=UPI00117B6996|nr:hypothetical protein [Fulvivirga sp. M361]TRX55989.1 hypothetical protein FNH22_17665 [Fulvivirga sp. M361]
MKDNLRILFTILVGTGIFCSCAPKYTADFSPSRTFYSTDNMETKPVSPKGETTVRHKDTSRGLPSTDFEETTFIASAEPLSNLPQKKQRTAKEVIAKYSTKENLSNRRDVTHLSIKEKKVLIKEVKEDIKALKKAKKEASIENKKVYAGIIIAAAGLLIAILASGALGGLAIIVGIALIAWGLIEDGTFS